MIKILFAAGGTAGHVNPALAIAQGAVRRFGAEVYFAGREKGMEKRLVSEAGYEFFPIEVHGIQRSLSPKNIIRNIKALWHLLFAPKAARKILAKVRPDLVVGTGGYVSGPVLREAAKRGYKTAIHEQNSLPGVTNRILAKKVGMVFAPTQSAAGRLVGKGEVIVSGNPVRSELREQSRDEARLLLAVGARPLIVSFGGSLGAMNFNRQIAHLAHWHLQNRDYLHIHATGRIEKDDFIKTARQEGIADKANFVIREYINDMPRLLAAADLIICRAGALTLAEIAAVGRASVLIPSPNVAENHQYYNALEFEKAGAAIVLEENSIEGSTLIDVVETLCAQPEKLTEMGKAAKTLDKPAALDEILDNLEILIYQ